MSQSIPYPSLMHKEMSEAPDAVRRLITQQADRFIQIAEHLRKTPPEMLITNARGSSDHASVFGKYLVMQKLAIPVLSGRPSIASIYKTDMQLKNTLCLSISQSGQSPDIVEAARSYAKSGAYNIAFTNTPNSPLTESSDDTIELCAGIEASVAATKSYIASLSAYLALIAHWSDDTILNELSTLPDILEASTALDWSHMVSALEQCRGLFVIGRGASLGIANEAALKFKETCQIHAEAFSAAECSHGPLALIGPDFPVLIFTQNDQSRTSTIALAERMVELGAPVFIAGAEVKGAICLPSLDLRSEFAPIAMIQTFYRAVADLAIKRGQNPDEPPALRKVTETL